MLTEYVIIFCCLYEKKSTTNRCWDSFFSSTDSGEVTSMKKAKKLGEISSFCFQISLYQDIQNIPVRKRISANA